MRLAASQISAISTAINCRIGVEYFLPETRLRHANLKICALHWRKVTNNHDRCIGRGTVPGKSHRRLLWIVANPLETAGLTVFHVQCWRFTVKLVEIANQLLDAFVGRAVQMVTAQPGQRRVELWMTTGPAELQLRVTMRVTDW